jgi:CRP/FNR family transcriptional regulator, cyclic AMP receptor protein
MAELSEDYFMVWGSDQAAYGRIELATLAEWVQQGLVTAESWIFVGKTGSWLRAKRLPELKELLGVRGDTTQLLARARIDPLLLRRINILAGLSDAQLQMVAKLVELEQAPEGATIVSQGQPGDSLYFILEGELQVCLHVPGKEVEITTLRAGDVFGDIALLDQGTRSADVVTNTNCLLARLSSFALATISDRAAEVATLLLQALDQVLVERIRADNRRLAEMVASTRQH